MPESPQTPSSLLSEILSAAHKEESAASTGNPPVIPPTAPATSDTGGNEPPKKKKEPINPLTLLKWIGAIFLVAVIFFGSFLAYIVFNPEQAQFFVTTFGIDSGDVADLLRRLITGSFGVILLILSILWIVTLFRAIWTPRDLKRKKILSWITAIFIGITLFSFVAFWAYLFSLINNTDFVNPEWLISVYDSELMSSSISEPYALITNTTNLIWPITLTFDIWANAAQVVKRNLFNITSYEINFDGAICNDGSSVIDGSDPTIAKWIVCTFDSVRLYNIRGIYRGTDRLGNDGEIPMNINPVQIRGLLSIKRQKNRNNEDIITLDASGLKNLWDPYWIYQSTGKEVHSSSITEKLLGTPQIVGLKLFSDEIDRVFLLQNIDEKWFTGSIISTKDPFNPLLYRFTLKDLNIDDKDIISINWSLNDGSIICRGWSSICEFSFWNYGTYAIKAQIELANRWSYTLEYPIKIEAPLVVTRRVKVKNSEWVLLNTDETFDPKLHAYVIDNIVPPEKVSLDARDVVTENPGYRLSNVIWTFTDDKKTEQKEGLQVTFDLLSSIRYTVAVEYIFSPNVPGNKNDNKSVYDAIVFDIEHKWLIPRFSLQVPKDYVPVVILIDWSQSYSESSEIKKFTYDFGEGKPPVSGDAIQQYEYKTAGEKTITLTITNDRGEMETTKRTIVLKENPKVVDFTPSISPGIVNMPIDFTPLVSEWDIADYIWTFGDNTPTIKEPFPSHTYRTAGKYTITLTIVYTDGTRKETRKDFQVDSELQ